MGYGRGKESERGYGFMGNLGECGNIRRMNYDPGNVVGIYYKIWTLPGGITERIPRCDALWCFRDGSRNEG